VEKEKGEEKGEEKAKQALSLSIVSFFVMWTFSL